MDAAIATGFALAVTYIDAGNIGGGGFMLTHMEGESALDYREKAALSAHRDMYLDQQGEVIENATLIGVGAAAVPEQLPGCGLRISVTDRFLAKAPSARHRTCAGRVYASTGPS